VLETLILVIRAALLSSDTCVHWREQKFTLESL